MITKHTKVLHILLALYVILSNIIDSVRSDDMDSEHSQGVPSVAGARSENWKRLIVCFDGSDRRRKYPIE